MSLNDKMFEHTVPSCASGNEPACRHGDVRNTGLLLGSGRSPGGGNGNHSSILAWEIPWTEEAGELYSPWGCQESDMTEVT